jgi:hypothetical protein
LTSACDSALPLRDALVDLDLDLDFVAAPVVFLGLAEMGGGMTLHRTGTSANCALN